jgi:hypothetical protein
MSEVEGYGTPQDAAAAAVDAEHETSGEPFDAEAHEAESADHAKFLETYSPCITRLPEALADERAAYDAEQKEARVQTLVTELGISEDEAREQVYGPSKPAEPEPDAD